MADQSNVPVASSGANRRERGRSRTNFMVALATSLTGSIVAGQAAADSLADVLPREVGADLGGTVSDRNTSRSRAFPKPVQASAMSIRATQLIRRHRSINSSAASRRRSCIVGKPIAVRPTCSSQTPAADARHGAEAAGVLLGKR
jgi:hypothetical protein